MVIALACISGASFEQRKIRLKAIGKLPGAEHAPTGINKDPALRGILRGG